MLQRSLHGGVAVAAAWAALEAAWVRGTAGEAPARGRRAVGRLRGDAWVTARSKGRPGRLSTAPAGGAVGGRRREQSREVGEGNKGRFEISKTSRDYSVNKQ